MFVRKRMTRWLPLLGSLVVLAVVGMACGGAEATPTTAPAKAAPTATTAPADEPYAKYVKPGAEVINFHDGQWASLWVHNAIAMYITEHGYGYPVEEIQGSTGTMKVALPEGDLDVNMEIWRMNIVDWYDEFIGGGKVVDLAGTNEDLPKGSKGQVISFAGQGFYVPTYTIEANPGLKSVSDLPKYKDLFVDPEDPDKGVVYNCIIGWQCQKIVRAKWHAYGLYDTYNVAEPGTGAALEANIVGAYEAKEDILSYYWEPTSLINLRDMTLLDEPNWTKECQNALDEAVESSPYESTMGCGFPSGDVHIGVHHTLVERAPDVTKFLTDLYMGSGVLAKLENWKLAEDTREWSDVALYYLNNNEDTWTKWLTPEAAARVKASLAS